MSASKTPHDERLERIEDAIGSLALLASRHAHIPWRDHPQLREICTEFKARRDATEAQTAAQLRTLDEQRAAILAGQ